MRSLTRAEIQCGIAELLACIGMTEAQLRDPGEAREFDARHRGVLSRIDGLRLLLGHARM